jgi:hypothetical protein
MTVLSEVLDLEDLGWRSNSFDAGSHSMSIVIKLMVNKGYSERIEGDRLNLLPDQVLLPCNFFYRDYSMSKLKRRVIKMKINKCKNRYSTGI